jgi:hypothetical protein
MKRPQSCARFAYTLQTMTQADLARMKCLLRYRFALERPHRTSSGPWEHAFGDPRPMRSAKEFEHERDRVVGVFETRFPTQWSVEILFYPQGKARRSASVRTVGPAR